MVGAAGDLHVFQAAGGVPCRAVALCCIPVACFDLCRACPELPAAGDSMAAGPAALLSAALRLDLHGLQAERQPGICIDVDVGHRCLLGDRGGALLVLGLLPGGDVCERGIYARWQAAEGDREPPKAWGGTPALLCHGCATSPGCFSASCTACRRQVK